MSPNEFASQIATVHKEWAKNSRRCHTFIIILVALYGMFNVNVHAAFQADQWADPGDNLLRHDLQLLADAGLLRAPLTTWPVAWRDIRQDIDSITQAHPAALPPSHLGTAVQHALARIRYRLGTLPGVERSARQIQMTVATDPPVRMPDAQEPTAPFRTFAATPRVAGEIQASIAGGNQRIAYRLQAQVVTEPEDGQNLRLDGSYATLLLGNWGVTLGTLERWWGPGWDGSLILSNNARPVPGLTLQRIISDPFPWQPFTKLGPWQLVFSTGLLEQERADIRNALLTTVRLNFKPTSHLEIGLSRVAQWGGEGRSEDMHTFFNMLLGQDNSADASGYFEPGNQLAGYDIRWVSPVFNLPYAIYGQLIGEDEAGNLPYKFIGLAGMEWWGTTTSVGAASYRLHVEYADTAVDFYKTPKFNVAYRHHLYSEGYVYRERFLGHTAGGDARSLSLGGILAYSDSAHWEGLIRWIQSGRGNTPVEHSSLEVRFTTAVHGPDQYQISTGLFNQQASTEAHASLKWIRTF